MSTKVRRSWSAQLHPDKDSLEEIRMMQAKGIKNKLKMDDKGWYCKFSHPLEKTNREGKVTQTYLPPYVRDREGKLIEGSVNNGATGEVVLDFYEHKAGKEGKAYAARLKGIILDDFTLYGEDKKVDTVATQTGWK
jgi:hypothetical protein